MSWIKLDDSFYRHAKARAVGKDGRELYIASICYSSHNLTDGFIAKHNVGIVAAEADVKPVILKRLVEQNLWEVMEGGWQIHDYADHQQSADAVRRAREKSRERLASWREKRRTNASGNGVTGGVTGGAETRTDLDLDLEKADESLLGGSKSVPERGWSPPKDDLLWASMRGFSCSQIDIETEKYVEWCREHGHKMSWRRWMLHEEPVPMDSPWDDALEVIDEIDVAS